MKTAIKISVVVILIIAATLGYSQYKKNKNKPEWRLDNVSSGSIREVVTASGTLNPVVLVNVGTEISGTISKLYKDFNSQVSKGELLAKLDTENLETALESAQTDVERSQTSVSDAKLDLDLQKELNKKSMGSDYDLQKAQNKFNLAVQALANSRFSLKRAEKNLQNAIITSPVDGVIVSRNVDEGQTVAASLNAPTLFVIANDLRKMQINADIDEADIGRIKIGLPVEFSVDAFSDDQFEGKVNQVRLSPKTEQNVVTYSVIIDVNNPEMKLLPGMTANVTIVIREKEDVLRVPDSALRFKPSKELWKLFGLKWDEALYGKKPFDRSKMSGSEKSTKVDKSASQAVPAHLNTKSDAQQQNTPRDKTRGNLPDSIKAKLAKMSPEDRKAFIQKQTPNGKPDFSKMTDEQKAAFRKQRDAGGRPDFANMSDEQRAAFRKKMMQGGAGNGGMFSAFGGGGGRDRQRKANVWILKDGKPVKIEVITGMSDGNYSEVIEGLSDGQEIITGVNYKTTKQLNNATATPFGGGQMGRR